MTDDKELQPLLDLIDEHETQLLRQCEDDDPDQIEHVKEIVELLREKIAKLDHEKRAKFWNAYARLRNDTKLSELERNYYFENLFLKGKTDQVSLKTFRITGSLRYYAQLECQFTIVAQDEREAEFRADTKIQDFLERQHPDPVRFLKNQKRPVGVKDWKLINDPPDDPDQRWFGMPEKVEEI